MTARRVRNLAARKCHDNMMPINIGEGGVTSNPGVGVTVDGAFGAQFLFFPSARLPGPQVGYSERSQRRVYARGYKERVSIGTTTDAHWQWRRIVFRMHMINEVNTWPPALRPSNGASYMDSTYGWMRTLWNIGDQTMEGAQEVAEAVQRLVFEGTVGEDWSNILNAKPDNKLITVISDRTRMLGGSLASSGKLHNFADWYSVNRTIVYGDSESGKTPHTGSLYSNTSKDSGGDIVVYDMFKCQGGEGDALTFQPHGTWYWHEGSGN